MLEPQTAETLSHREADVHAETKRGGSLLVTSAVLATGGALVAGGYGIYAGLVSLEALSLEMAMVAVAVWVAWHRERLDRRIAETEQASAASINHSQRAAHAPVWSGEEIEEDYDHYDIAFGDLEHARKLHYLLLALSPTALIGLLGGYLLVGGAVFRELEASTAQTTALGIASLAVSCIWLALTKSYGEAASPAGVQSSSLRLALRELHWATIAVAAAVLAAAFWPRLQSWVGGVLLVWVLVLAVEQFVRYLLHWLRPGENPLALPPLRLVLRELVVSRGNPAASFFEAVERRLGVNFRSSWAIRFVRGAVMPAALLVALLLWGLTSLAVVEVDCLGVREHFGRVQSAPLSPGLHWKLPWPLGRLRQYPVKQVSLKPIGFISKPGRQAALLWTKEHAREEFALVLGGGSELLAIDSVVYYKIREDKEGFLDYVYHSANPDVALEAYAYRALMEQTRTATLAEVFSANRAEVARRLKESLQEYATANRLGIDVVEVALMGLHPPVEAGADYLDVISARIDADRETIEATGEQFAKIQHAQRESTTAVAEAKVQAARRVGEALEEASQFLALGQAYAVAPAALKLRLWFEILEEVLENKRFVVVDKVFSQGHGGVLLDQRAEINLEDPAALNAGANPR